MAETIRTSTLTERLAPIGSISLSCSARSSLTWTSSGSSPTSSRNKVPPLASWNLPRCLSVAPVKLPFSWPNRMDSTRFSGIAPQFTATNGLPARSDEPCTARAMTSLPTPLSPVIRIGIEDLAARSPSRLTRVIGAESPIRSLNEVRLVACFFSRSTSPRRSPIDRALRIDTMIRSGLAGLMKKSTAPACMACTTVSMPPVAVTTITGVLRPRARISVRVSWPEIPGITRSSRMTSTTAPDIRC